MLNNDPVDSRTQLKGALTIALALLAFIAVVTQVYGSAVEKVTWCHTEPNGNQQTLELPQAALEQAGHMDAGGNPLHAGDHAGACTEPTPTPPCSPTPTLTPSLSPSETATPTPTSEPNQSRDQTEQHGQVHYTDEHGVPVTLAPPSKAQK